MESAAPDDAYAKRLKMLVDDHHALPMQNAGTSPWHDFLLFMRYVRLLRKRRPAVLLTYTIKPNIYGSLAARMLGIPVIANISGLGTAFLRDNWLTRVATVLYRLALRPARVVFFQNAEDRELFLQRGLVTPQQAVLIPGSGVDLDYFRPTECAPDADAPVRFVLIARLLWDKGIGEYIEAARQVKVTHPRAQFRLVGPRGVDNKTAIPDAVIDQWVTQGIVDYLGETDAVRDVLAAHDCVVLPSYREGLSRILLEAAAMGKPIITTDVPGCRQVVDHEKTGLLCRVQDAGDLAVAMRRLLDYPVAQRTQMGTAARAKAEQEFDEAHVFDAYLTAIKQLAH